MTKRMEKAAVNQQKCHGKKARKCRLEVGHNCCHEAVLTSANKLLNVTITLR